MTKHPRWSLLLHYYHYRIDVFYQMKFQNYTMVQCIKKNILIYLLFQFEKQTILTVMICKHIKNYVKTPKTQENVESKIFY